MIKAKQVYCGECEPYGGFLRIWNVQTDLPQDEVVNGALRSSITERFFRFTQNGKQTSPMERPISATPAIALLVTTLSE